MDNVAKQQLIEQLKPIVNEPEFEAIFTALTADLSGPDRFKLKTELRTLARPCRKIIDLRNRVDGHCRPYKHKGFVHYMDDVAVKIFEAGLEQYRGIYTEDTHQQVHNAENNFRIIERRERERTLAAARRKLALKQAEQDRRNSFIQRTRMEDSALVLGVNAEELPEQPAAIEEETPKERPGLPLTVSAFTFGRYVHRKEERMNFSVAVALRTPGKDNIEALTTNISINGMRVKISSDHRINVGEETGVRFTGLAQEFTFDPLTVVPYRVVGVEDANEVQYLRLVREMDFESVDFDAFFERFIHGYKRRYKINVDNTYNAVVAKGHEQFYFPRMSGVPLFFKLQGKHMFPDIALETENNADVLDAWLNEDNISQLPGVFTGKRLSHLLRALKLNAGTYVHRVLYSFQVLRQGTVTFYTAMDFELNADPELKRIFLAYASRTNTFKVYNFTFSRLDLSKAWSPVTLPDDILEREKHLQRPPAPDVMQRISGLTHCGLLQDITPKAASYHSYQCTREELVALKSLALTRKLPVKLDRVVYSFVNFRSESRFGYRTRVRARFNGKLVLGTTRDISTMGMQIDLEEALDITPGTFIELDLMQLAKRSKQLNLSLLRYELMSISEDKTTLHLRADVKDKDHHGRHYIEEMIENNQDELLNNHQSGTLHGLQLCLRNLYSYSLMTLPLFLHRPKHGEFSVGKVGLPGFSTPIKELCVGLSKEPDSVSLNPLMNSKDLVQQVRKRWLKQDEESHPKRVDLYVVLLTTDEGVRVVRRYKSEFDSAEEENKFIKAAMLTGCLLLLQLQINRTGEPDIAFINNEFKYVNLYAVHKAKQLERDLWSVVGLVDVVDCTPELMTRLQLTEEERALQAHRLEDTLAHLQE